MSVTIAEKGAEVKIDDAAKQLLNVLSLVDLPAEAQDQLAPHIGALQICLSRRRDQSQAPGGRVVIGLSREHAGALYAEMGKHSIHDDWALTIFLALHRTMEER